MYTKHFRLEGRPFTQGPEPHFYVPNQAVAYVVEQLAEVVAGRGAAAVMSGGPGVGKSALLATDQTWRWALSPQPVVTEKLYRNFWGQLLKYLAGKETAGDQEPELVANLTGSWLQVGTSVPLEVSVFDDQAKPSIEPRIEITVSRDGKDEPAPRHLFECFLY